MSVPIILPTAVLPPQSLLFTLINRSTSGGLGVSGTEQVVISGAQRWRAKYVTRIVNVQQRLLLHSMLALSDGRANPWIIPVCAGFQIFTGSDMVPVALSDTPLSDGSKFSDGSEYVGGPSAIAVSTGSVRAVSLTIQMSDRTPPLPGMHFSTSDDMLYRIASVQKTDLNLYSVNFRPGLRSAVTVGDVLDFSRPRCRMRLANDNSGDIDLELLRFAPATLEFLEDF